MNGGHVKSCEAKEYGRTEIEIKNDSLLFKGLPKNRRFWMSHVGDQVAELAEGYVVDASSDTCPFAATTILKRKFIHCSSIQKFVTVNMEMIF